MIQLFAQLAQSVTGAVITIIALLLVAAIIGYFTAWFYAKSVYTPVIKGLEADKQNLITQVAALNEDVGRLNGKVDKLNEDIKKLQEEIAAKDNAIAEKEKEITALKKQKITS
jgi:peptidoglycan hydrolase CwlO-like protein